MMQRHELKTIPLPFQAIWEGRKAYELRPNDRPFKTGDELLLREWDDAKSLYTGRQVTATITYITEGGTFGLPENRCVLSIKVLARKDGP